MNSAAPAAANLDIPNELAFIGDHGMQCHIPSGMAISCLKKFSSAYSRRLLYCLKLCYFSSRCWDHGSLPARWESVSTTSPVAGVRRLHQEAPLDQAATSRHQPQVPLFLLWSLIPTHKLWACTWLFFGNISLHYPFLNVESSTSSLHLLTLLNSLYSLTARVTGSLSPSFSNGHYILAFQQHSSFPFLLPFVAHACVSMQRHFRWAVSHVTFLEKHQLFSLRELMFPF